MIFRSAGEQTYGVLGIFHTRDIRNCRTDQHQTEDKNIWNV